MKDFWYHYFQSSSTNPQNGITSSIKNNSLLPKLDINFSPLDISMPYAKVKPYISAGASVLNEFSSIEIPQFKVQDNVRNSTIGINAGAGLTLFDKIDIKAGYIFMPTSENVKGMFIISGGYRFLFLGK